MNEMTRKLRSGPCILPDPCRVRLCPTAAPEEDSEGSAAAPECASTESAAARRPAATTPAVHETVTSTSGSNGFTLQPAGPAAAAAERR